MGFLYVCLAIKTGAWPPSLIGPWIPGSRDGTLRSTLKALEVSVVSWLEGLDLGKVEEGGYRLFNHLPGYIVFLMAM
ncbi:hypothetical protein TIFTF001_023703 [Ficus carica]|uniref:Uncharacterized protein n=1 Tax=Ficus carica TaxID=3494 RepID=A0AA88ALG0_FICCA|nr:hypothetical protein TIFTF001_023703 [Ficus carica]